MSNVVTEQLRHLAGTLADLQNRVRQAVAGEVGRAVAEAVGEVLAAALGGTVPTMPAWARAGSANRYGRPKDGYGPTDWDDPDDPGWDPDFARLRAANRSEADDDPGTTDALVVPAALAVAVAAGRWWLARRGGSPLGAAGAGLAAGTALLAGGPAARSALAVLLAVHRLLSAADALGEGARAVDPH